MNQLKEQKVLTDCRMLWQIVLNLRGNSKHKIKLTGEALDEDSIEAKATDTPFQMLGAHKLLIRSFFGDHDNAAEIDSSLQSVPPGSPLVMLLTFHRALSLLAVAQSTNDNHQYKNRARKYFSTIKRSASHGNPNAKHYEALLEAEFAVLDGRKQVAKKHYGASIELALSKGFLHDAACASERFGAFLLHSLGQKKDGVARIKQSMRKYSEWGAHGKVESMEQNYSQFIPAQTTAIQKTLS